MGKLKVDLLGTSFTIQANEETEYLEKLLGYYKRITDDVQKIDTVKTPLQISILSGIMLCDELYKEKKKRSKIYLGRFLYRSYSSCRLYLSKNKIKIYRKS